MGILRPRHFPLRPVYACSPDLGGHWRGIVTPVGVNWMIKPFSMALLGWLFIGHPDAGWRSAVIYTIIQSCRRRGINPQEYSTDVLGRLPAMKNHEVKHVLPSRWKPSGSGIASPATL